MDLKLYFLANGCCLWSQDTNEMICRSLEEVYHYGETIFNVTSVEIEFAVSTAVSKEHNLAIFGQNKMFMFSKNCDN